VSWTLRFGIWYYSINHEDAQPLHEGIGPSRPLLPEPSLYHLQARIAEGYGVLQH